ncbi:MAG: DEAD/DEAH box helicase [Phenylobacterium sp.]|uniref:DEAD/DEAH box helicase n=1 Tax=Phenylobacterium sp. TaxID=1871053 RepID=UPI001B3E5A1A|nr:DEAD/DEAH box helicase [Phenylobacterium sp.]MBP7648896.1 DEAD/DEAH box helicase [Phenylobacterium sp.]MBP7815141.1 DEAD/DEAH box helicase [Phenylobacterium sp.]MBP9755278.1 DEAD/DEAH box helicase [Phenylobacterium sp.]
MTEFSELGLSPATLQAVADTGYTTATPIQAEAIPVALQGRDVLGIAQTGTGKTAAFTLPMIDRLAAGRSKARMPRALVIAPTRELADQVSLSFEKYAKGQKQKLSWALLIGGVSFGDQEAKLDRGVDVLIATPGRLLDHFERGKLLMTGVQIMVVDEADRMLDMGFIPDIERIFKLTPAKKQTLFFSATMPPEITRLTKQFLNDPVRIEATRPATTADTISQYLVRLPTADAKAKRTALRMLIGADDVRNGIVFCNRKTEVDIVAKSLKTHGFDAAPIHGDLDQATRMRTLEAFRKGELKLLCASDVAARGLDVPDVSHVFNYDVPHHADDYVHRIGRTGRAGKLGKTYMIVTPADAKNIDKVLKLIGKAPEEIVLEGVDFAAIKDEKRSDSRSGGRDRGRGGERSSGRGDRDRDRERPRAPHGEVASLEPFVADPNAVRAPKPEPVAEEAKAERAPRARGRNRGRANPDAESAATEAVTQPAEARAEREPRRARPERESRPEREARPERAPRAETAERPERTERPRRERDDRPRAATSESRPSRERDRDRPRREDRDDGDRVVGFGNDMPAFLKIAPTRPPSDD